MLLRSKVALICGVSGQDGGYLAKLLISKGYVVWGTSRDAQGTAFINLKKLGILGQVKLLSMVPEDFRSVFTAVKQSAPDEIYFLAGQSSVGLSFEQPAETIQSVVIGTLNMLEACRMTELEIRLYHAGSSSALVTPKVSPLMSKLRFTPVALTRSLKHQHFGWWTTIVRLTAYLLVRAFCLIMNPRCGHRVL